MTDQPKRLGEILVEWGLISKEQLLNALKYQRMMEDHDLIASQLDVDDSGIIMLLCKVDALVEKLGQRGLIDPDELQHEAQERFIVWEEAFPQFRAAQEPDSEPTEAD